MEADNAIKFFVYYNTYGVEKNKSENKTVEKIVKNSIIKVVKEIISNFVDI